MESFCAIIFTIILLFPLVIQLQMLIADPKKLSTIFHYYATSTTEEEKSSVPKLLQYYPKLPISFESGSDSKLALAHLRTIFSSPALPRKLSIKEIEAPLNPSTLPPARQSSSFIKTNKVLPVVDITLNYNSFRYDVFESSLRNQYGNNYPPGNVVLNSMQLNFLDSKTKLNWTVRSGLFDFVKESDIAVNGPVSRTMEIEYLNPLDHFVTKQDGRPSTVERFTETLREVGDQGASSYNERKSLLTIRPRITAQEKNTKANQRSSKGMEYLEGPGLPAGLCKRHFSSPRHNQETSNLKTNKESSLVEILHSLKR